MGLDRERRRLLRSRYVMKIRVLLLAAGLLAAVLARRFVTISSGLTYTLPSATRYIPFNIVIFWLLIIATVVVCISHKWSS
jgi:hypothetical protein